MSTEREALRLQDIIDNVDRIVSYVTGMEYATFAADGRTIDAVERCLQRLTEAAIKIGPERRHKYHPDPPWKLCAA